jgi:plasmid stabilization system protein ParE
MTQHRFTSSALSELKEATLHYEEQENGLGRIFLDEIDATIARILTNPLAWHPLSKRTRRCRTHRFPFGLIYQIQTNEILILSVMDLRRDPISWKHLLMPDRAND